ncbi:MAG: outer membrane protein assembly factor BamA [Gammaproteobacteria bacterium]
MQRIIKQLKFLIFLILFSTNTWAVEEFIIEDIRLEGLSRVSAGNVFNNMPVKIGDKFNDQRSSETVKALFKSGFFKDVRLERVGNVLVIALVEREAISKIILTGNDAIKTDDLLTGLGGVGFAEGEVFNRSLLDKVEQELSRQYFGLGRYGAVITTEVIPQKGNRVQVAINVSEGETARIKEINIVGNTAYTDKQILKKFELSTPTLISFVTKNDQYSKQKLSADLETIKSLYLDNGFINFNIDSTQVSITPDKKDVYITININEGDQFSISDVKLSGELIVPTEDLFKSVLTHKGEVFARKDVTNTSEQLTERIGDEGYAFANVNAVPEIDNETKKVALTYFIDPGKRVYVRRINFSGNTKTRDEVLRREMRQAEGGWISTEKVQRSKVRLQRLGFFEDVNVETPAVAGTSDQVDVNYSVVERASGNLSLGFGFSQVQGIIFNTNVTQDNFLGSGKRVSFNFNNSEVNRSLGLGYTNPYWTIDGVSRGFNTFYRETDANNANVTRFNSKVYGTGVNFGIPITEFQRFFLGLDYENTELDTNSNSSSEVTDFIAREGNRFDIFRLTSSFAFDSRNRAVLPDQGVFHQVRLEGSIPLGDLRYYKISYDTKWFLPLAEDYTLLLKGSLGYGDSYGSTEELPFFENFYGGGPRSIRGFEENTLGPKDSSGRAIGGNLRLVGNAELILPVPFISETKSMRLTGFIDGGNVYDIYDDDFDIGDLRYSVGISGIWVSPFGVLSASIAKALNDERGDQPQTFQFTFGTSF